MVYKKKLILLSGLTALLALIYTAALIFDPERVNARNAAFVWLDAEGADRADSIVISRQGEEIVSLVRKNGLWFVPVEGIDFPAKQARVEDLFRILSTRGAYPLRAAAAASHERLGLAEEAASRIVIRGGAGAYPLLDLLAGDQDAAGREMYLRKQGQNEVRSGDTRIASYINGAAESWYDLRLFPEGSSGGAIDAGMIQRLIIEYPGGTAEPLALSRSGAGWTAGSLPADTQRVESYIRSVLDAEGETFLPAQDGPVSGEGRIALELGDGTNRIIRCGPLDEEGKRRNAQVTGSPHAYRLAEWTLGRLFREASYFTAGGNEGP
ncbi:MAG: DUF4340 domain-containing protein [Treponema sp.]|jgi:hypothetical protein|nr:DUF4340 domain-containing protein [Treponema sp.]